MNDMDNPNFIDDTDQTEFSLDSILSEFSSDRTAPETGADTAHIGLSEASDTLLTAELHSDCAPQDVFVPEAPEIERTPELLEPEDAADSAEAEPEGLMRAAEDVDSMQSVGDIASLLGLSSENAPVEASETISAPEGPEISIGSADGAEQEDDYAAPDYPEMTPEQARPEPEPPIRTRSTSETIMAPIISLLAMLAVHRQQRKAREKIPERRTGTAQETPVCPEMQPKKAARLYGRQLWPLQLRGVLAGLMTFLLVLISYLGSYGAPLAGAMNGNVRVMALVCLMLELVVMLIGADVFIAGLRSLCTLNPAAESLVAVSCAASALDALIAAIRGSALGLPFCAVSALSMTAALWGARLTCAGYRVSFRTLAQKDAPYTVTSEPDIDEGGSALLKSRLQTEGFVRRSEEPDIGEMAYRLLTPLLIAAALILSLLNLILGGGFIHCFSAIMAAASSLSSLLCFALPFAVSARCMRRSGAAVAGWAGCREIGKSRRIVVTDADLFPPGTLSIAGVRILEGVFTEKVISCTGSLLAASGSALAAPFTELMGKNGCTMQRVDDFSSHDGGGLTASIRGEKVYVGSSGFMNLMGIRVPQKLSARTSVFTAVGGQLVGIFSINYTGIYSVQEALVTLMRSRCDTIFAIRDFNITPQLIRQKFKIPAEGLEFPPFAERYRISAANPGQESVVSAILSREGLGPLAEAADRSRRLYNAARLCTFLSLLGSVMGMLLMFLLCRTGAYSAATVGNLMTFMLFWLAPTLIISWGLKR